MDKVGIVRFTSNDNAVRGILPYQRILMVNCNHTRLCHYDSSEMAQGSELDDCRAKGEEKDPKLTMYLEKKYISNEGTRAE